MNIEFRSSFLKDLKKVKDPDILQSVEALIVEFENAGSLQEIKNCKKITSSTKAYRIRINDYRIGFFLMNDGILLCNIKHRKDIYKFFP
jgi:mRNA interferase RelE/StbE